MPNFYCSHCGQPIQAQEGSAGMEVGCPACHRPVRVPGLPRPAAPSSSLTWLWIGLAVLLAVMLTAARLLMPDHPSATDSSPPKMASFLARTLSTLALAGIPALLLAAIGGSLGLLTSAPFSRLTGLIFSILLMPLTVFVLFGDSLTGGKHMQNLTRQVETKADAAQHDLASLFTPSSRPSSTPTRQEVNDAISGIKEDTEKLIANINEDGLPQSGDLQLPTLSEPTNDIERLRVLIQSFFNDMVKLQNDYLKELQAAGIETLLDVQRIHADADFSQSDRMITEMRKIVQTYKVRSHALVNGIPERVNNMAFDPSRKAQLLEGIKTSLAKSMPVYEENLDIEIRFIELGGDVLDHLKATRQRWSLQEDGQLLFEDQADLDHYILLLDEMDRMAERQAEIRQQGIKSAQEKMKKM